VTGLAPAFKTFYFDFALWLKYRARTIRHTIMANIIIPPDWALPERRVTSEAAFWNRRAFLRRLSAAGLIATTGAFAGCSNGGGTGREPDSAAGAQPTNSSAGGSSVKDARYPARRNPEFSPKVHITDEEVAGSYNNFYEFSLGKETVRKMVGPFVTSPWSIEIAGLVDKPMTLDLEDLLGKVELEERVYRFRCVEAWAMVVPWTGFPFRKLIEMVSPKPEAKFIRLVTFNRPDQAPNFTRLPHYPWPYHEGLRMDEALHPLTLVATGIYGKPLPKQHGAPIRLVVPWKYGYKSIKSIVRIEFVATQPPTFWETLAPDEYPFESNVNPAIPHPRWSQAFERIIDTGDSEKTTIYNGYGNQVASLYSK
jgi:sulfoxide reductase catalytic subunit YedY